MDIPWRRRRVRTPTVLQMEAVECGAASLTAVLGYHGRHEPLERIRVECDVSRDGSNAADIVKAARRFGMTAAGRRCEIDELRALPLPAILHWNFNHFVVLEGFSGESAYINDPATGPRRVSASELDESFTGIALTLEPGESFERSGHSFSVMGGLAARLRGSYRAVTLIVALGLLLALPGAALAAVTSVFVDQVLIAGDNSVIAPLLGGLVALALLQVTITWLQQRTLLRLQNKLAIGGLAQMLWHLPRLPMEFFMQRFAGEIARRAALTLDLARLITSQASLALVNAMTALAYVAVMLTYNVALTAIAIAVAVTGLAVVRVVYRLNANANERLLAENGRLQGVAVSGLLNIETIKATGREPDFFARWAGHHARVLNAEAGLTRRMMLVTPIPVMISAIGAAAILVVGGVEVISGDLSVGELVGFQTLAASFAAPMLTLSSVSLQLQRAGGSMKRTDDILDHPPLPGIVVGDSIAAPSPGSELQGALELRRISFGYDRLSEPLIKDFDLKLEPGARVALIGPSGSGKSTIAKLVAGLYQPWEGEILLDGRPRESVPRAAITSGLATVDQQILLFEGSIRENLLLWDTTVPEERMVAAARDACIHEEIIARPGAYRATLEEGGSNLSGGQRQRLEIARALVADPRILILDEATSALDPIVEEEIDARLRERDLTCVIVAHRLSTVRDADEILVLSGGAVTERGTHEELIARGGRYAELARTEAGE